jgi:hypothetical protein
MVKIHCRHRPNFIGILRVVVLSAAGIFQNGTFCGFVEPDFSDLADLDQGSLPRQVPEQLKAPRRAPLNTITQIPRFG